MKDTSNRRLVHDIESTLNPLVESGILKIKVGSDGSWDVKRIEGSFDYEQTKKIILSCLSIIRNHERDLASKSYLYFWAHPKMIAQLEEELYLIDKVFQAFFQALSTSNVNLNTKLAWDVEMRLVRNSQDIVVNANNTLQQRLNEGHVKAATIISAVTLFIAAVALLQARTGC